MAKTSDITANIRERIESGQIPVGEPIPTQVDIEHHWGVARKTSRTVVANLLRTGMVARSGRRVVVERDSPLVWTIGTPWPGIEDTIGTPPIRPPEPPRRVAGRVLPPDLASDQAVGWRMLRYFGDQVVQVSDEFWTRDAVDPVSGIPVVEFAAAIPDDGAAQWLEIRPASAVAVVTTLEVDRIYRPVRLRRIYTAPDSIRVAIDPAQYEMR